MTRKTHIQLPSVTFVGKCEFGERVGKIGDQVFNFSLAILLFLIIGYDRKKHVLSLNNNYNK